MSYEKIGRLLNNIHSSTSNGLVTWDESALNNAYELSFSKYSVRICREGTGLIKGNEVNYHIQIINDEGDTIEDVTDQDLEHVIQNPVYMMKEIHDIARRQVLGVEKALDDILDELAIPF